MAFTEVLSLFTHETDTAVIPVLRIWIENFNLLNQLLGIYTTMLLLSNLLPYSGAKSGTEGCIDTFFIVTNPFTGFCCATPIGIIIMSVHVLIDVLFALIQVYTLDLETTCFAWKKHRIDDLLSVFVAPLLCFVCASFVTYLSQFSIWFLLLYIPVNILVLVCLKIVGASSTLFFDYFPNFVISLYSYARLFWSFWVDDSSTSPYIVELIIVYALYFPMYPIGYYLIAPLFNTTIQSLCLVFDYKGLEKCVLQFDHYSGGGISGEKAINIPAFWFNLTGANFFMERLFEVFIIITLYTSNYSNMYTTLFAIPTVVYVIFRIAPTVVHYGSPLLSFLSECSHKVLFGVVRYQGMETPASVNEEELELYERIS